MTSNLCLRIFAFCLCFVCLLLFQRKFHSSHVHRHGPKFIHNLDDRLVVLYLLPALASSAGDQIRVTAGDAGSAVSGRFLEKSKLAVRMSLWAMTCSLLLAAAQRYIHQLTINSFSSLRLPVLDILILTTINYTRCIFFIFCRPPVCLVARCSSLCFLPPAQPLLTESF